MQEIIWYDRFEHYSEFHPRIVTVSKFSILNFSLKKTATKFDKQRIKKERIIKFWCIAKKNPKKLRKFKRFCIWFSFIFHIALVYLPRASLPFHPTFHHYV